MGIKVTLRDSGVFEQSGEGVEITPHLSSSGFLPMRVDGNASTSSPLTAFTASVPGFYWVSGSTATTGTMGLASAQPGSQYIFASIDGGRDAFLLTGSRGTNEAAVFYTTSTSSGSITVPGSKADGVTIARSGSVCLQSDGRVWMIAWASGSFTLRAGA